MSSEDNGQVQTLRFDNDDDDDAGQGLMGAASGLDDPFQQQVPPIRQLSLQASSQALNAMPQLGHDDEF